METKTYQIKSIDEDTNEEVVDFVWILEYQDNQLKIERENYDEDGEPVRYYVATQPYRTNPDGTTQPWESAEDAFQWFTNREGIS